jgi:hypothetical protein
MPRRLTVNPRDELLNFIVKKKIPIQQAIDILEQIELDIKGKRKPKEKAILPKYETRAGG